MAPSNMDLPSKSARPQIAGPVPRMRSEGTSRRAGEVGASEWVCPDLPPATYEVTASQIATHSPSDKSKITIKDAAQLSRDGNPSTA